MSNLQGGRSKRKRKSKADPFLANRIQHVWNGSNFQAPTDSDTSASSSAESDAESNKSHSDADSDNSDASGDDADANQHEDSDLSGFIENDVVEPAANGCHRNSGGRDTAAEVLSQERAAAAASTALQQAGFRSHQSDADYFADYLEYMVYDLVDKTFAVRVLRDRQLHQQYQEALRKVEEQLSSRRCLSTIALRSLESTHGWAACLGNLNCVHSLHPVKSHPSERRNVIIDFLSKIEEHLGSHRCLSSIAPFCMQGAKRCAS